MEVSYNVTFVLIHLPSLEIKGNKKPNIHDHVKQHSQLLDISPNDLKKGHKQPFVPASSSSVQHGSLQSRGEALLAERGSKLRPGKGRGFVLNGGTAAVLQVGKNSAAG